MTSSAGRGDGARAGNIKRADDPAQYRGHAGCTTRRHRTSRAPYRIAKLQYDDGMADYLAVVTAERSLLAARDAEVQAQFERLAAAVSVYQALGGGWRMPSSTATALEPVAGNRGEVTEPEVKNCD